jgi:hypothetical protein
MNFSGSTWKNRSAFHSRGKGVTRFPFSIRFRYAALTPSSFAASDCFTFFDIRSARSRCPMFALSAFSFMGAVYLLEKQP